MTSRVRMPSQQTGFPAFLKSPPDHFFQNTLTVGNASVGGKFGISQAAQDTEQAWSPFFGALPMLAKLSYQDHDVQHETLPDGYDGDNALLTQVVIQQVDEHDDDTIRFLAPLRDFGRRMKIRWNRIIFNNHMLRRAGEESLTHLGTHRKETQLDQVSRYGMSLLVNAAFKETKEGQEIFKYQIMQIANATISTLCHMVAWHLMNAPAAIRDDTKYRTAAATATQIENRVQDELDNWAILVKDPYGAETVVSEAKKQMESFKVGAGNWMRWPNGAKRYHAAQPYYITGRRQPYSQSAEGPVVSIDTNGLVHTESIGFVMGAHQANEDPQFRERVIGGFVVMNDLNLANVPDDKYMTSFMNRRIFNEKMDSFVEITQEEAINNNGMYHPSEDPEEPGTLSNIGRQFMMLYDAPHWGDLYKRFGRLGRVVNQMYNRMFAEAASVGGDIRKTPFWKRFESTFKPNLDAYAASAGAAVPDYDKSVDEEAESLEKNSRTSVNSFLKAVQTWTQKINSGKGKPSQASSNAQAQAKITSREAYRQQQQAWLEANGMTTQGVPIKFAGADIARLRLVEQDPNASDANPGVIESTRNPFQILEDGHLVYFAVGSGIDVASIELEEDGQTQRVRVDLNKLMSARDGIEEDQATRRFFARLDFALSVSGAFRAITSRSGLGAKGAISEMLNTGVFWRLAQDSHPMNGADHKDYLQDLGIDRFTPDHVITVAEVPKDLTFAGSPQLENKMEWLDDSEVKNVIAFMLTMVLRKGTSFSPNPSPAVILGLQQAATIVIETEKANNYSTALGHNWLYDDPSVVIADLARGDNDAHDRIVQEVSDEPNATNFFTQVQQVFLRTVAHLKTERNVEAREVFQLQAAHLKKLYHFFAIKTAALRENAQNEMAQELLPGITSATQLKTAMILFLLIEYVDANEPGKSKQTKSSLALSSFLFNGLLNGDVVLLERHSDKPNETSRIGVAALACIHIILEDAKASSLFNDDAELQIATWGGYAGALHDAISRNLTALRAIASVDSSLRGIQEASRDSKKQGSPATASAVQITPELLEWLLCHDEAFSVDTDRFQKFQLANNGLLAIGHILAKPSQRYTMGSALYLQAGGKCAFTAVSNRRFRIGTDAGRDLIYGQFTLYAKTIVQDPRRRIVCHDVLPVSYNGGNNTEFYDPLNIKDDVDPYERGIHYKDIFALAVPINWKPKSFYFSITGRFPQELDTGDYGDNELHYPTASIYSNVWKWDTPATDPITASYFERASLDSRNTIVFQNLTFEFEYNAVAGSGSYNKTVREHSHWGDTVYEGCAAVRRGKKKFFEVPSTRPTKTISLGPF